jgi:hypothetical protein
LHRSWRSLHRMRSGGREPVPLIASPPLYEKPSIRCLVKYTEGREKWARMGYR